jgi:hypothetical protein
MSTWLPRGFAVAHAENPGTGHSEGCPTDGAPNENDSDVLVDVVYTRQDETYPRMICRPLIEQIGRDEDRITGNRNAFWDERNLNALVPNMHAGSCWRTATTT